MNILFLILFNIEDRAQIGVSKKIGYQIDAMRSLSHNVDFGYCKNDLFIVRDSDGKETSFSAESGMTHYRKALIPILGDLCSYYDLVFIRFPGSIDFFFYKLIKTISKNGVKVVLEMPTYPIRGEMLDIIKKQASNHQYIGLIQRCCVYSVHTFLSRQLHKYLHCIVSYSDCDMIWGTRTINIENGIDCSAIAPKFRLEKHDNIIRLIFVAVFAPWHGLDRLIDGMVNYYDNKEIDDVDVEVVLIGNSEELKRLINTAQFIKASTHFKVCGALYGQDLENEYNNADIAISSLGMHRIGLTQGSTLKTREYCAKGIPFIYGYKEKNIDDTFPFALRVPADESAIDIEMIIEFYNSIKDEDYVGKMREFAKQYDWKTQISLMMDCI